MFLSDVIELCFICSDFMVWEKLVVSISTGVLLYN